MLNACVCVLDAVFCTLFLCCEVVLRLFAVAVLSLCLCLTHNMFAVLCSSCEVVLRWLVLVVLLCLCSWALPCT